MIYLSIKSETTPSKPLNKNWSGGHFVLACGWSALTTIVPTTAVHAKV